MSSYATRRAGARNATRAAARYGAEARDHIAALAAARAEEAAAREALRTRPGPIDLDALRPGDLVRIRLGWYPVKRVNANTVTVGSGDRIPHAKILETHHVAGAA